MKLYRRIEAFLDQNPGAVMTYSAVAEQMDSHPIAVAQRAMRALGDRGRTDALREPLANIDGPAEIIIAKNRGGGIGTAHVRWFQNELRFSDLENVKVEKPGDRR